MLRDAPEPLTVREIALGLARKGGKDLDGPALALVVARVRNAVPRMSEQLEGELRGLATYGRVRTASGLYAT